jgi:hypothetical protein
VIPGARRTVGTARDSKEFLTPSLSNTAKNKEKILLGTVGTAKVL